MPNETLSLIRAIGSPFDKIDSAKLPEKEKQNLFEYAFNNRIGLLYLFKIGASNLTGKSKKKFNVLRDRYERTLDVVARVASILNSQNHEYAVIKTIKPYMTIPNDTDILYLGTKKDYVGAMKCLESQGYHFLKMAPMQTEFYDPTAKEVRGNKKGGIYHIDLYREVAADYIIYLDKYKLLPYLDVMEIRNIPVKVFKPEAELAITLMHGVFPELSYQLQDFYTILYFLDKMNNNDIDRFIHIIKSNHIKVAISASFTITSFLYNESFGYVPRKIQKVLNYVSKDYAEIKAFKQNDLKTPYTYKFSTFLKAFMAMAFDNRGLASFFVQGIHMLNPVFAYAVLETVIKRKKGKSYKQV